MRRRRGMLAVWAATALTAAPGPAGAGHPHDRVDALLAAGRPDSAAALVPAALAAASRLHAGSPEAVAACIDSLGLRFFEAGDGATGVRLLEHGLAVRDSSFGPDGIELASPLELLATGYYLVGRVGDAVAPLARSLAIRTAAHGDADPAAATTRYTLAIVYYHLTRYEDAESQLRASLAVREAQRDSFAVAEAERALGEVCRETNRYAEAETRMRRALSLARDLLPPDSPECVVFINSLAGFYRDQARYDEAELLIEEAIEIRTRAGLEQELAIPTLNLAEIYRYQGRVEDAVPLYRRALVLAEQHLTPLDVAEFHNQLAAAYAESGEGGAAAAEYERALAIVRDSPHASPQVVAQFEHDYGVLRAQAGDRPAAEDLLGSAIARRESVFGPSHPLVAASLTELARLRMTDPTARASAAALLDRAIAMLDSSDAEPEAEADARAARAELFALEGRTNDAIAEMAGALGIVEALRPHRGGGGAERVAFMGRYRGYYDRMTEWEIRAGNVAAALAYSERMRARVLVDRVAAGGDAAGAGGADAERLRARRADLEGRLQACQARVRELRAIARPTRAEREELARSEASCDALVEDLQRASDRLQRAGAGAAAPAGPEAIVAAARRVTPPQGAVVAYHVGEDASHVFVVTPEGGEPRCHALVVGEADAARLGVAAGPLTRAALTRALTGFDENGRSAGLGVLRQMSEPPPAGAANPVAARALRDQDERLAALFRVLVPEAAWKIVRARPGVVIVPDGPLFALPFEALVTETSADRATMWIDAGPAVWYTPSIALLDAMGRTAAPGAATPNVLSVCNPRFDAGGGSETAGTSTWVARTRYGGRGGSLAPLPGTERESDDVAKTFGAGAVTTLRGDAATERAVRDAIAGRDIVHLATHGLVSLRRSDLLAALALTPVSAADLEDDGFLQMFEIFDLPLSARLVVLSACESSHGRYAEGEGVMALSNGFHAAGARQVVATLWKVDDDASAVLIRAFFARVAAAWDDGGDVARALRDAKRTVRADAGRSHPFYWAAFVASGRP